MNEALVNTNAFFVFKIAIVGYSINRKKQKSMFENDYKIIYRTLLASISLTLVLFTASLFLNTFYTIENTDSVGALGIFALLFGFFSMNISWYANPCLLISLLQLKRGKYKKAFIYSSLSVLLGLSFLFYTTIMVNEGGRKSEIVAYGIGYWFWLSSLVINFIGIALTIKIIRDQSFQ